MKKFLLGLIMFVVTPFMASAAVTSIGGLLAVFKQIIDALMPFVVGLAVLYFIWGVFQFVASAGDEEKRTEGRNKMIYGIIGIFVMVSVWGLVNILQGTFGTAGSAVVGSGGAGQAPDVPTTGF